MTCNKYNLEQFRTFQNIAQHCKGEEEEQAHCRNSYANGTKEYFFFRLILGQLFFIARPTEDYDLKFNVFLQLLKPVKKKTTLPVPVIYICCTYINTC